MIFLHLSDIHFRSWSGSKFDLDEDLRLELLLDAEQVARNLGPPAGVLVTGDIAFAGAGEDYLHAKEWLAELCAKFGRTIEIVWSVPGNHDVNRACVSKSVLLRDQHGKLRSVPVSDLHEQLAGYLRDPEASDILFRPISEYNRFAGAFGCAISGEKPCWNQDFLLNDGWTLRITGLHSTVVSDDNDGIKNLIVGQYQVPHREAGVVDLIMCHHPPDYWRDQDTVESMLDARARVQLFGHKHKHRLTKINNTLRLSAGAVQPARKELSWQPRYNWLSLDVVRQGAKQFLDVDVYPRVWGDDHRFRADLNSCGDGGQDHCHITLDLEEWNAPLSEKAEPIGPMPTMLTVVATAPLVLAPVNTPAENIMNPARTLTYRFFDLPHIVRIDVARPLGLYRDEDEGLQDFELFGRVFERAITENALAALWDAVEQHHADGRYSSNPFESKH